MALFWFLPAQTCQVEPPKNSSVATLDSRHLDSPCVVENAHALARNMESSTKEVDWPCGTRTQTRTWWTASTARGPNPGFYTRLGLPLSVWHGPLCIVQLTVFRAIFCLTFHLSLEAQLRAAKVISCASTLHRPFGQLVNKRLHQDALPDRNLFGQLMVAQLRVVELRLAGVYPIQHSKRVRCCHHSLACETESTLV